MAFFDKKRIQDVGILAIAVLAVQIVLSKWIYPLFGQATQTLFAISPQTAITSPTIGNKIIALLSGIIPLNLGVLTSWLAIFLGAFILLLIGSWIYDQRWAWKGKNVYQRIWALLLYGTVALYILLLITKISEVSTLAWPLLVGVSINYLIIGLVISFAAKYIKIIRV